MDSSDFLIWTSDYAEGFCVIRPPVGIEKSYQLSEGVALSDWWPRDAACQMSADFPKDIALADNLYGAGLAIVSERLRGEIEAAQPSHIEFLPVSIVNHKGRQEPDAFFFMNPLAVVDCIYVDASKVRWNRIDPSLIKRCARLVIRPEAVPKDISVFRPKHWPRLVLVRRSLAERLVAEGFTGLVFTEPLEFTGLG